MDEQSLDNVVKKDIGQQTILEGVNPGILLIQKHFNATLENQNEFFKGELEKLSVIIKPLAKLNEEFIEFQKDASERFFERNSNPRKKLMLLSNSTTNLQITMLPFTLTQRQETT